MTPFTVEPGFLAEHGRALRTDLEADFEHLGRQLRRRGVEIERLVERAQSLRVALPSWGLGTGGTRFARFPGPGEPRDVFEKLDDCATVHSLVRVTPEDVAEASCFFASGRTSKLTGNNLNVDGGVPAAYPR